MPTDITKAEPVRDMRSMHASVLCGVRRLEVREVPIPEVDRQDVLVRVSAVGICGTDFHIFEGHANYNTDTRGQVVPLSTQPQILGHEITGTIEAAGAAVRDLGPGDRVVVDQGLNCVSAARASRCEYCATGDSHQCEFYREHGITGLPGGLAQYISVPAVNAVKINSMLESVEAALTEPLGCIVHSSDAVSRATARYTLNAQGNDARVRAVLVCGAGPAGLLFVQYLRNVLGYEGLLIVSEPNNRKRELASRWGAVTLNPAEDSLVEGVQELTRGRRVEYLIDASGSAAIFAEIPGLVRKQATILLYGHGHSGIDLEVLNNVQFMEPTLVSSVGASGGFDDDGRPSTYRRALALIEEGKINVADFITHHYRSLDELPGVFADEHRHPEYIKGVVSLS